MNLTVVSEHPAGRVNLFCKARGGSKRRRLLRWPCVGIVAIAIRNTDR